MEHISLAPPASFVGEAALKSSNYPTGIVLLEKMLNKMSEMDIKKGKKAQQLEETPKEVADLWNQVFSYPSSPLTPTLNASASFGMR